LDGFRQWGAGGQPTYYKRVDFVQGGYCVATAQVGYRFSKPLSSLTANNLSTAR
jgi:hypothetical protein